MVLVSKNFPRALWIDLDPKIWKKGSNNLEIRISGSGSVCRTLKFFLLTKIIYGLPLLLLKFFDLALPSRSYSIDPSEFY